MVAISDLVTIMISVYNEEKNLPLCFETIKEFKHKIIIDSGSTDRTQELAKAAGCRILNFEWNGHPPKKRTWALRNHKIDTPWVLFLDADERLTEAFKKELAEVLPTTKHDVFWVSYDNWFLGKMLKHGDVMRKDAILRVGHGEYEQIEEDGWSNMPIEMHEHILTKGTSGTFKARLEHHDKRPLANYYKKHCDYSDFEARRYRAIKDWSILTRREKIKYGLMRCKLFPLAYWFVSYILKGGFLDGAAGFYFAMNKMSYFYQIQSKIFEVGSVK